MPGQRWRKRSTDVLTWLRQLNTHFYFTIEGCRALVDSGSFHLGVELLAMYAKLFATFVAVFFLIGVLINFALVIDVF